MQQGCNMDQRFYSLLYRNNIHKSSAILLTSMFITSAYHTQNRIVNKIQLLNQTFSTRVIDFLNQHKIYQYYCKSHNFEF